MGRPRSEATLLAHAQAGDGDAYAELVRAHQDVAFRTAMLITQDAAEAEDAAQEGFVRAWRALPRFQAGRPLRPWLLTIVANEARNRRRAGGRREHLVLRVAGEERPAGGAAPSPEAALLAGETRTELSRALARLDEPRPRSCSACRFLLDLGEEETAAALGVRRGTVKSRTSRALARLRAVMDEGAGGPGEDADA